MAKINFQAKLDPEIASIFKELRKKWKTTNEGVLSNVAIYLDKRRK